MRKLLQKFLAIFEFELCIIMFFFLLMRALCKFVECTGKKRQNSENCTDFQILSKSTKSFEGCLSLFLILDRFFSQKKIQFQGPLVIFVLCHKSPFEITFCQRRDVQGGQMWPQSSRILSLILKFCSFLRLTGLS